MTTSKPLCGSLDFCDRSICVLIQTFEQLTRWRLEFGNRDHTVAVGIQALIAIPGALFALGLAVRLGFFEADHTIAVHVGAGLLLENELVGFGAGNLAVCVEINLLKRQRSGALPAMATLGQGRTPSGRKPK